MITSLKLQRNPLSCGTNEDKYCAVSTSIPSGKSSERYPLQLVRIVDFVVSVPKVAIRVQPKFSLQSSFISFLKNCPLSFFISFKIKGLFEGHKSKSISVL